MREGEGGSGRVSFLSCIGFSGGAFFRGEMASEDDQTTRRLSAEIVGHARAFRESVARSPPRPVKLHVSSDDEDADLRSPLEHDQRSTGSTAGSSGLWNRDDDELVSNAQCRGGIGVLLDSMVEEIIDDIVTERLSNVYNTLGPSASEYGGTQTKDDPFAYNGRPSGAIRLGHNRRDLYDVEEEENANGCGC